MFYHIFKNRLKCIIRDKTMIFWTLAFPLILATFFNLALSNIDSHEMFNSIDIAVVKNEAYQKDENFRDFLEKASQGDSKLFNIQLGTEEEAEKLLDKGKVVGYILVGGKITLNVKNSGIYQTIVKSALDQYIQTASSVTNIATHNPKALSNGLIEDINDRRTYTKDIQLGRQGKPDSVVTYFYALIAMSCLYGAFFGLKEITDSQADLSKRGARLNVAPVHKLKALIAGLSAAYIVLLLEILTLMSYLVFILKVDFGNQIGYIFLTCIIGCTTGLSFGAVISAVVKKREGVKIAILIGGTMTMSFLSGMMFGEMKYIIEKNVPALSYINPAALIADALYSLYFFDSHTRFFTNIGLLSVFTIIFSLTTYLITRRRQYASL